LTGLQLPLTATHIVFPPLVRFEEMESRFFAFLRKNQATGLVGRVFAGPSALESQWAAAVPGQRYAPPSDTLGLNFKHCDDEMVACLASALVLRQAPHALGLKRLVLRGNLCGPHAVVAVCAALIAGACPVLEAIDLAQNPGVGDGGAFMLADALGSPHCARVTHLDLDRTCLSAGAVFAVVNACAALPALHVLKVGV
jgi:hypothetical protein